MARIRAHQLSFHLLLIFIVPSCGVSSQNVKYEKIKSKQLGVSIFSRRELLQFFFSKETIHDNIEPPVITYPSPPNIPGDNPSTIPVPVPNTTPTSSSPPSTNAVTQPVMPSPAIISAPPSPGRGWCVAKSGAPQAALQAALDYACGIGGVDCSVLQQGGSCYNPVTLENHASYAFNSFYQRNPVPSSCDFGATAMITSTNPSSGSCIFPTSVPPPPTQNSTQTPPTPPTVPTPPAFSIPPPAPPPPAFPTPPASPTPPVSSSGTAIPRASGSPVSANKTNNTISGIPMGGFPIIFPTINNPMPPDSASNDTSMSIPRTLPQPFISGVILLTFIVTWNHVLVL